MPRNNLHVRLLRSPGDGPKGSGLADWLKRARGSVQTDAAADGEDAGIGEVGVSQVRDHTGTRLHQPQAFVGNVVNGHFATQPVLPLPVSLM